MQQFRTDGLGESAQSVFRRRVGRLQRNAAIGDGGQHLHDHALVARTHPSECDARSVDGAVQVDIHDAAKRLQRNVCELAVEADTGIVDPYLHRAKCCFQFGGPPPRALLDLRRRPLPHGRIRQPPRCFAAPMQDQVCPARSDLSSTPCWHSAELPQARCRNSPP